MQVYWGKLNTDSICVLKFSPCGRFLASGSHDQHLDVYDVKVSICVQSSTVQGTWHFMPIVGTLVVGSGLYLRLENRREAATYFFCGAQPHWFDEVFGLWCHHQGLIWEFQAVLLTCLIWKRVLAGGLQTHCTLRGSLFYHHRH